jgi:hypothetical protein
MDIMYSPVENKNIAVRMGINKKKHIIKGVRYIKPLENAFDKH